MLSHINDANLGMKLSYFAESNTAPSNVIVVYDESEHGLFKVQHLLSSSREVDRCCDEDDGSVEVGSRCGQTEFVFATQCGPKQGPLEPGRLLLTGPSDLNSPGIWDSSTQRWLRVLMLAGCAVDVWLWEDQPAEPKDVGELLLWPAALVLARCLDSGPIHHRSSLLPSPNGHSNGGSSKFSLNTGPLLSSDTCHLNNPGCSHNWLAELVRGSLVVELGAGAGLPSLVASLGGAKCVVATDGAPDAVDLLHANMAANQKHEGYSSSGTAKSFHRRNDGGKTRISRTETSVSLPIVQRAWWGDAADVVSVCRTLVEPRTNDGRTSQTEGEANEFGVASTRCLKDNIVHLEGANSIAVGAQPSSSTKANVQTLAWPDIIIGSDITFSSNLHDELLTTLAGDPLKVGDSVECTLGAACCDYDGRCGLLGPHTVCVLAHDNDSTPLSRTSLRDFVSASRCYRCAVAPSCCKNSTTTLSSAVSLWCTELPPPWRPVLNSAGVNSVPYGKRVRKPSSSSKLPTLALQQGQFPELHPAWPPEWEASSVTLLMVRRWSPIVELVRAWWAAAVPTKDLPGNGGNSASPESRGAKKKRSNTREGVERHRLSVLASNDDENHVH